MTQSPSTAETTPFVHPEVAALPPELLPDETQLVTEDDTPVDNIFSEKQQRLLTESLYSSWGGPGDARPFLAMANVGLFYAMAEPPLVPDTLLSLDVRAPANPWPKANRSYFIWRYGKTPDVVIEVVSNRKGGEDAEKLARYAAIGIPFYVIFDPEQELSPQPLRIYGLYVGEYRPHGEAWLSRVQLGLKLWHGVYEDLEATWLRWCIEDGTLIPTGAERAEQERVRAEQERVRAEQERVRAEQERVRAEQERTRAEQATQRAEQEYARAERLAARLRELGLDPDG
jgi:hypothetical protein